MDLSRTRSYFLPGYPLDVVVCMTLTKWLAVSMTVMILHVKDFACCYYIYYKFHVCENLFGNKPDSDSKIDGHASP